MFTKELNQVAQGNEKLKGTDTIRSIKKQAIPAGRTVMCGRICVHFRPQKEDTYRTRLTIDDNRVEYPWEKSTPTAGITTSNILFNSVLSTPDAKFFGIDIAHFYLCTPLAGQI